MNFDPRLVQRLTRPLKHPGVTNHRMSEGLLERFQVLANRLPLLDRQMSRWSTVVELDAEQVPIVYAQSFEGDLDDLQENLVGTKQEMRSPAQKNVKNADLPKQISPSSIDSGEAAGFVPAIASSAPELSSELSFVQLPQNSDSKSTIERGLPIPSEPSLPKASSLVTNLLTDLPTDISTEAIPTAPKIPSIPIVPLVSNAQPEIAQVPIQDSVQAPIQDSVQAPIQALVLPSIQPLGIQAVSENVIQARYDRSPPSISHAIENSTDAIGLAIANPIAKPLATQVDSASDERIVVQEEISSSPIASGEASVTLIPAIAEIPPAMIGVVDMPIIPAQWESGSVTSKMSIVTAIATGSDSALDVSLVMQEISSNATNAIAETTPLTINTVSEPVIQAKEDLSTKARSPIVPLSAPISELIAKPISEPISEPISFNSAIAPSEQELSQELSLVQSPQSSDATLMGQRLIADLPQIPIVTILNPPPTLSSKPLSFPANIDLDIDSGRDSERSEQQISSLQVPQINTANTEPVEIPPTIVQVASEAQPEILQPLVMQPVNDGVIQARYDSAASSTINAQPLLASLPEVSEIPWTSPNDSQNSMPIVNADPIVLSLPSIGTSIASSTFEPPTLFKVSKIDTQTTQNSPDSLVPRTIQEPSLFEQTNIELPTVHPSFTTQNVDNSTIENATMPSAQTSYSSQDSLMFTASNTTPVNVNKADKADKANKIVTISINPNAKKSPDAIPSNNPQKQLKSSPLQTPIVREKVSTSNFALSLARETNQISQPIVISTNNNFVAPSSVASSAQSPTLPTVQAIVEISEQTFEPLLLSRHNASNSTSEMAGNHPNQSIPKARAIANSSNRSTYPTSNSSTPNNPSTQLPPVHSAATTNNFNPDPPTLMRPQNIQLEEARSANTINMDLNMDLLVAQVERKIIKRLIVEGERRGKRKWL
ncbi:MULTISPECIES: hypothetical protein [Pseudanabaena]|uniref:Uncharacterized protein n=2 Tax=Pseudanabaena TaxID=1152 RepID=L8N4L9_9CYAN|nr:MULTISPECIES: hypothetical protein [Pseudanabaena]ELS34611.1 hypothetical protein Pse7429DRAFT_0325 [Pseudanabaena biceps PCC 7429]MDG3493215.1 hypothetical protein [Pseudanabaena catenata USMAC16]